MKLVHKRKLELLLLIKIFENEDIFYSDLLLIHTIYTMVPNSMLNGKKKEKTEMSGSDRNIAPLS
jgi:hypothetical protein